MTQPTIPATEHRHVGGSAGGPGENSAECACETVFDGFDTHAEATALMDQHIADAANTVRADQLKAGDWVARLIGGLWDQPVNAEVEFVRPYTDAVANDRVFVVASAPGEAPKAVRLLADSPVRLLTDAERAAMREQAERAEFIAGLHEFADWLTANPWAPIKRNSGYLGRARLQIDMHRPATIDADADAATVDRVREIADRLGVKVDESLDDRTDASITVGSVAYSVIAWHRDGRPVEPSKVVFIRQDGTAVDVTPEPGEVDAPVEDLGFGYSRVDDDPQVVRPHSPRVPLHTGAVVDGGVLVDETPAVPAGCDGEPCTLLHHHPAGETESAAPVLTPSGLTPAADLSRGPLAGTSPVVTYFSFGHGQTDPGTRQKLIDHYVTVVAPTYEECRTAMFASRFGRNWSWEYLAGRAKTTEAVTQWTEHEVIVAPGTDEALAKAALKAAGDLLYGFPGAEVDL